MNVAKEQYYKKMAGQNAVFSKPFATGQHLYRLVMVGSKVNVQELFFENEQLSEGTDWTGIPSGWPVMNILQKLSRELSAGARNFTFCIDGGQDWWVVVPESVIRPFLEDCSKILNIKF